MGIVKTFTQFSTLNKYLEVCSLLINNKSNDIPTCMVRNDFNHVMKLISSWFRNQTTTRIKNFYLRSIGLVISSTNFEDIKKILRYIFVVSLSETDGLNLKNEPTDCEVAKQYLKQRIATHSIIDDEIGNLKYDDEKSEKEEILLISDDEYETIAMHEDINVIYNTCLLEAKTKGESGDHDNMQYDPSIAKKLNSFCKLLPCWSAVMTPIFGYGSLTESSASSESLFKDLKRVIFKHKTLPIRIDSFVNTHITSIIGDNCMIQSKIIQNDLKIDTKNLNSLKNEFKKNVDDNYSEVDADNNALENWRGLGEPEKKRKKPIMRIKIHLYYITMKIVRPKVKSLEFYGMEIAQI